MINMSVPSRTMATPMVVLTVNTSPGPVTGSVSGGLVLEVALPLGAALTLGPELVLGTGLVRGVGDHELALGLGDVLGGELTGGVGQP
jgi:hypothetical protein